MAAVNRYADYVLLLGSGDIPVPLLFCSWTNVRPFRPWDATAFSPCLLLVAVVASWTLSANWRCLRACVHACVCLVCGWVHVGGIGYCCLLFFTFICLFVISMFILSFCYFGRFGCSLLIACACSGCVLACTVSIRVCSVIFFIVYFRWVVVLLY